MRLINCGITKCDVYIHRDKSCSGQTGGEMNNWWFCDKHGSGTTDLKRKNRDEDHDDRDGSNNSRGTGPGPKRPRQSDTGKKTTQKTKTPTAQSNQRKRSSGQPMQKTKMQGPWKSMQSPDITITKRSNELLLLELKKCHECGEGEELAKGAMRPCVNKAPHCDKWTHPGPECSGVASGVDPRKNWYCSEHR